MEVCVGLEKCRSMLTLTLVIYSHLSVKINDVTNLRFIYLTAIIHTQVSVRSQKVETFPLT